MNSERVSDEWLAATMSVVRNSDLPVSIIRDLEQMYQSLRSAREAEPAGSFQMLMDAYIRGNQWAHENGLNAEGVSKAAYDYADKTTSLHPTEGLGVRVKGLEVVEALHHQIDEYWRIAWQEGNAGRVHDNEANDASRTRAAIDQMLSTLSTQVQRLTEENEALRELAERLKLEAQGHASEARTANSTIYEIYQALSGSKGEPGNWHGAEPARRYVEASEARIKALEEALGNALAAGLPNVVAEAVRAALEGSQSK